MEQASVGRSARLTRRQALRGMTSLAALALLPACAQPAPAQPTAPPPAAQPAAPAKPAPAPAPPVAQPGGKTKIIFAWPFAGTSPGFQEDLARRFNEQSKSVEVEVLAIPQEQVLPKLTTAFSGGAAPDALAMSPAWLTQFAAAGWLENLDPQLKSSGLDKEILPVALTQGRMYKDTSYMAGFQVDVYALFYNKDLYTEAGLSAPPATVDEVAQHAKKLTDASKNRFGYYLLGGSPWSFQQWSIWMLTNGGLGVNNTLYDAQGKSIFSGPKHVAGLERWVALYRDDKISPPASATANFNDARNAFSTGQIGIVMGFLGYIGAFSKGLGPDKFGVAPLPAGPAGQFFHYGCNGYCISAQSKNKDAAWEYLRFLLTPEISGLLSKEWGAIPAHTKALSEDWLNGPLFQAPRMMAQKAEAHVHTPRQLPEWAKFFESYAPEQNQKTLLGQQTPKQFGDNVSAALNDALAKAS